MEGQPDRSDAGDTDVDSAAAPLGDTGDEPADSQDEAMVRALVADGGDPAAVAAAVAWSGGWPVATSAGTFLFLALGDAAWSLAGDHSGWAPAPMARGAGFSWLEVEVPTPNGAGYKLFADDPSGVADPLARSYRYDDFGRLSFVRPPRDTPHLERWPGLTGQGLRARDVDVWVPAGPGPWPLVVMHDGRNLFDPEAIWGGWRLDEALATLGGDLLVVGLDNTPDRFSEYTHVVDEVDGLGVVEPLGDAYADLVVLDVVPWAESTWSTDGRRAVVGSSLGGLISLHIASRHPDVFDLAASLSGTLGWGRFGRSGPVMEEVYAAAGERSTRLYVDSGGGPGEDGVCSDPDGDGFFADDPDGADNYCTTRAFADRMAALGYGWEVELRHWWEPGAPHAEIAWAERVASPLAWVLELP